MGAGGGGGVHCEPGYGHISSWLNMCVVVADNRGQHCSWFSTSFVTRDSSGTHLFDILLEEPETEALMELDLAVMPELLDHAVLAKHLLDKQQHICTY